MVANALGSDWINDTSPQAGGDVDLNGQDLKDDTRAFVNIAEDEAKVTGTTAKLTLDASASFGRDGEIYASGLDTIIYQSAGKIGLQSGGTIGTPDLYVDSNGTTINSGDLILGGTGNLTLGDDQAIGLGDAKDASISFVSASGDLTITSAGDVVISSANIDMSNGQSLLWNGAGLIRGSSSGGVTINESGHASYDFRVESDSNTHMLFVDAGNDLVEIRQELDAVSNEAMRITGNSRATALDNDEAYITVYMESDTGTMEFARLVFIADDVTAASADCTLGLDLVDSGETTRVIDFVGNAIDVPKHIRHMGDTDTLLDFGGNNIAIQCGGVQVLDCFPSYIQSTVQMRFNDNIKLNLGTAQDAGIYYNASDLVLAPQQVGSGNVLIAGANVEFNTDGTGVSFDIAGTARYGLLEDSDVVCLVNRGSNGTVDLRANTATGGSGGEVAVATIKDTEAEFFKPVVLPAYTDGTRPTASTLTAGASIFNTSDNFANYSDGTNWRDPTGAIT